MNSPASLHLDLDGAWAHEAVGEILDGAARLDCTPWGAPLRFSAPRGIIEAFYREVQAELPPFLLYGSGDYHYLTALWLRKLREPFTLISFDNHPDWDTRPPHWCCGNWISRALTLPHLRKAVVWGCGNFELEWPNRMFANHRGIRAGRLEVHPWSERLKPASRARWDAVTRENWRARFADFARSLAGGNLYVTVDIDCLASGQAATNWENGLFEAGEIAWALGQLRACGRLVGGDLCGAYSPLRYARFFQRLISTMDHPRLPLMDAEAAAACNLRSLEIIWPALTGGVSRGVPQEEGFTAIH